jgi:hypothetical protein
MPRSIVFVVLTMLALVADTWVAAAQSPTSYPWCARTAKMDSGGTSCYFTSYQQCMTTLSGLGGPPGQGEVDLTAIETGLRSSCART